MGLPVTGQVSVRRILTTFRSKHSSIRQHYNLVALAFYLGFLTWVFPTMYISQRLRLGKYLGTNVVLWGIVMMLHAVPKSFGPFFLLRLLLGTSDALSLNAAGLILELLPGALESCVAPILILIISMFYTKKEQVSNTSF